MEAARSPILFVMSFVNQHGPVNRIISVNAYRPVLNSSHRANVNTKHSSIVIWPTKQLNARFLEQIDCNGPWLTLINDYPWFILDTDTCLMCISPYMGQGQFNSSFVIHFVVTIVVDKRPFSNVVGVWQWHHMATVSSQITDNSTVCSTDDWN